MGVLTGQENRRRRWTKDENGEEEERVRVMGELTRGQSKHKRRRERSVCMLHSYMGLARKNHDHSQSTGWS